MDNYNYKPVLLQFSETELRNKALEKAQNITLRFYQNGNSDDVTRKASTDESTILFNCIYGALSEIRYRDDSAQVAMDTAENIADMFIPNINGYCSVYIPIWDILTECRELIGKREAK